MAVRTKEVGSKKRADTRKSRAKKPVAEITVSIPADKLKGRGRSWDLTEAIKLRTENGLTYDEIGQMFGVTGSTIHQTFARAGLTDLEGLQDFKSQRADVFAVHQRRVLDCLSEEKLQAASVRELAILFGTLYDKERLERGKSTQNTSVFQHVISQACQD